MATEGEEIEFRFLVRAADGKKTYRYIERETAAETIRRHHYSGIIYGSSFFPVCHLWVALSCWYFALMVHFGDEMKHRTIVHCESEGRRTINIASLKSVVKRNKMATEGEEIEFRCVVPVTDGKKTIATWVTILKIEFLLFLCFCHFTLHV